MVKKNKIKIITNHVFIIKYLNVWTKPNQKKKNSYNKVAKQWLKNDGVIEKKGVLNKWHWKINDVQINK